MNHKIYKQFPLLRPKELFAIFATLRVPDQVIAKHCNVTRQSVYRWRKQSIEDIKPSFVEALNAVAYRLLRAAKANKLPPRTAIRPALIEWDDALDDALYPLPLADTPPQQVLPNSWLVKFNIQPDSPDVAS